MKLNHITEILCLAAMGIAIPCSSVVSQPIGDGTITMRAEFSDTLSSRQRSLIPVFILYKGGTRPNNLNELKRDSLPSCYPKGSICVSTFDGLALGKYFACVALVDSTFFATKGKRGVKTIVGYYMGKVRRMSNPKDLRNARRIDINNTHKAVDITMKLRWR